MRISKITVRETREVDSFQFNRVELEVSVLKDDDEDEAAIYATEKLDAIFRRMENNRAKRLGLRGRKSKTLSVQGQPVLQPEPLIEPHDAADNLEGLETEKPF